MGEFQFKTPGIQTESNTWSSYYYLKQRQYGTMFRYDSVVSNYYKYMTLKRVNGLDTDGHGAIFNTEFSPDGRVLVAACEQSAFLMFDPLNQKLIQTHERAHDDGINCVRFLDCRSFLTCSDDKTIALWDMRNLKAKVYTLVGHTSWVKSIEYCRNSRLLVTSAFDDTIRVWDMNKPSNSGFVEGRIILKIARLTRMKLTPCDTKMIISSIAGHLVIIHNLDLEDLATKPGNHGLPFWSMPSHQKGHQLPANIPCYAKNKFEVIEEFPEGVKPWCISSLEVHPHGWCVVIRYSTGEWHQEWTAVYDVQSVESNNNGDEPKSKSPQRLIYCIEEPNVARGYIKEPCFSNDGRVIGSPFGNTSRLLTFSKSCDELSKCVKSRPSQLTDFKTLVSHTQPVLTSRFSPTHPLLSSGCRGGKVAFFYPHL